MAAVPARLHPDRRDQTSSVADLVVLSEPEGLQAEAIRALRTHIIAQHVREGRRAIAVGGPHSGAGCSFVAANLSLALAQVGIKTLLVDSDLRRPAIDRVFGITPGPRGLLQALEGGDEAEALIVRDLHPNLSALFAGGAASNPLELLSGLEFENVMSACMRDYEMTIIDTPPANHGADLLRVSSIVGYALIIARERRTFVNDVDTLARELRVDGATIIGSVMLEA